MIRLMFSIFVAATMAPVFPSGRAAATEPVTTPAEFLQRVAPNNAQTASPGRLAQIKQQSKAPSNLGSAPAGAGQKPKEIVVVGGKEKRQRGGTTTSTDDWEEKQ